MIQVSRGRVARSLTIVAAQSDAQTGNRVVVNACRDSVFVGNLKFIRTVCAALNPVAAAEAVGVQSGKELCLVAEIARASPETDTSLMPCTRQNGVLSLRTVDREEVKRFVIGVGQSERHDDMTGTDVGKAAERLLKPELLKFDFTALFSLKFVFDSLFCLVLNGLSGTSVLKFYLRSHGPSLAEIVAHIDHSVRNVETSVVGCVLVNARLGVAFAAVGIEIARHGDFTITAYTQPVAVNVLHDTVSSDTLGIGRGNPGSQCHRYKT